MISTLATSGVTVSFTNNTAMARAMLTGVNTLRSAVGASTLKWDSELEKAAQQRAAEISMYFSHTRPDTSSCFTVLSKVSGENILYGTAGYTGTDSALNSWANSSGHYSNMVNSSFSSIGIACVTVNGYNYWVQLFSYSSGDGSYSSIGNSTSVNVLSGQQIQFNGSDRYETAAALAKSAFSNPSAVVIASGSNFADALSASSLAGLLDNGNGVPILLNGRSSLNSYTKDYITSHSSVTDVYIIGGFNVVSSSVENELKSLVSGHVTRIYGEDRYETSTAVADYCSEIIGYTIPMAFMVSGENFPDALSASAMAYDWHIPIILVSNTVAKSQEGISYIRENIDSVIIVGGTSVVTRDVESQILNYIDYDTSLRVAGDDRYETSALMALLSTQVSPDTFDWYQIAFATGNDYPDALAGAAYCCVVGAPMLLLDQNHYEYLLLALQYVLSGTGNGIEYVDKVIYLGGNSAFTTGAQAMVRNCLWWVFGNQTITKMC